MAETLIACPVCGRTFRPGRVHTGFNPAHTCETHPHAPEQLHIVTQTEGVIERRRQEMKEKNKRA
jgi:hypothetical protein